MFLRLLRVWLRSRRGPRLGLYSIARTPFRVSLLDLDVLRHMNNGRYLTVLDLGRMDLMYRSGMWERLQRNRIYPVVAAQTITYRRSLDYRTRFFVETRVVGVDERSVFLEQRFVVRGEVHAVAHVRGRFLRAGGGTVPVAELLALLGAEPPAGGLPEWVRAWSEGSALPAAKASMPSVWPEHGDLSEKA